MALLCLFLSSVFTNPSHFPVLQGGNSKLCRASVRMGTVAFADLMITLDIWVLGCVLELVAEGVWCRMASILQDSF